MDDGYISVDQLMGVLRDSRTTGLFEDAYETAIQAASRAIDQYCDDQFWLNSTPIDRPFQAEDYRTLWTGSIGSATGLVVKFDLDDDGDFEYTVPPSSYQLGPVNRRLDRPWDRIELLDGLRFPGAWRGDPFCGPMPSIGGTYTNFGNDRRFQSLRARVQVTAQWGWPSVPWQVKQACQILAIDFFKSKDMTGNSAGTPMTSAGSFGAHASYQVRASDGMNSRAAALLCGLRDVVVA